MRDLLAALNAALIPLSAIFLATFIRYQYASRHDDQSTAIAKFGWSLFMICLGMFSSAILYFLWDYDFIYKSTQYKLSILPRGFFIAGLVIGFNALEVRWNEAICIFSFCLFLGVFIARVL